MRARSTSLVRVGLASLLPLAAYACGTPPTPTSPTTAPSVSASTSTSTSSTGPSFAFSTHEDRSHVSALPSLVVEVHVASPRAITRALKALLPMSMQKSEKLEARGEIADALGSRVLAQIVDIDKSVDVAVALRTPEMPTPKRSYDKDDPVMVLSFPVEPELDGAAIAERLKGTFRLEAPDKSGVIKITTTRVPKWDDPDLSHYYDCAIFPALGDTPHRLMCTVDTDRPGDLAVLGPWLARGAT
ncbi:MAG: hypothetical protein ACHREM_31455, partial [Polyangiales bacterium]